MKSSFANADQEAEVVSPETTPVAAPSTALVPASPTALAQNDSFFSNEGLEGEFDQSDIKIPRFSVVQAVGPLSGELGFIPGQIVYNKETIVGTVVKAPTGGVLGTEKLKITLLRLKKYFMEDLPYGSEERPAMFKSSDDARAAGFLPVQDKKKCGPEHKYFKPLIDADILVEGDASNVTFPFNYNGTPFAIARWTLQSTAYTVVGKQFATDAGLSLRAGLQTKFYTVSCKKEKVGANWVFVPRVQLTGLNDAAFQQWIKDTVL